MEKHTHQVGFSLLVLYCIKIKLNETNGLTPKSSGCVCYSFCYFQVIE